MSVTDADGEVVVADEAQLPEALAPLGHGGRERQYPDEIRSADLVLFRPQDHEVAAVVGEIARIRRLILLVDLPVTLGQVRQLRWHAASHVAKLLDLDVVVQRHRGVGANLSAGARAVERFAVPQHTAASERRREARSRIDTGRMPRLLHLGDGVLRRGHVASRANPARPQARGQCATAWAQGRDVQWDWIAQVDDVELRAQEADLAPLALERPLQRLAGQQVLHDPDVLGHVLELDRGETHGAPRGESGGDAEVDAARG